MSSARLAEAFGERLEAELLLDLLKEDLDKDSRAAGRVLFVHVDDGERGPAHTVGRIEVTEEARDVAEAVGLVSMDGVVVVAEALFEVVGPLAMELAEALAHVAVELAVGALLGAALYDHVAKLNVLTFGNLELEELVHALFKVERGHDGEIDGSPQVARTSLEVRIRSAVVAAIIFAQDLCLDSSVALLIFKKVRVVLEDVEALLDVELIIQTDGMRDLVVLFDQVEGFWDAQVVLEAVAAHLREHLDHVLHALADVSLVEYCTEPIKDAVVGLGRLFGEESADLAHETDGDLDAIIGGIFEQEDEDLERQDLVDDALVDEMSNEHGGRVADGLVVALE
ncbi:hypothetical protein L1887_54081 [Cichorium endivia]|nr:hypothetical protein L1887_54081 [Cichorium endivia]